MNTIVVKISFDETWDDYFFRGNDVSAELILEDAFSDGVVKSGVSIEPFSLDFNKERDFITFSKVK